MQESPLAITDNAAVRAEIERVAAAAGVAVDHVSSVATAAGWRRAPLVLLDSDQVASAAAAHLPRRDGLVVLAHGEMDAGQWACCLTLGVHRVLAPDSPDGELVRMLAEAADGGSDPPAGAGRGRLVAVVGACGGAGATVLAVAIAGAAARAGRAVLLADVDPWSPGIDVTVGVEGSAGVRWGDISASGGRLAAEALHRALPSAGMAGGSVSVLGHGRAGGGSIDAGVLDAVLDAASRAGEVAVVDLPRTPSPAADRAVGRADLTVLVSPAQVRGCYGAAAILPRLTDLGAHLGMVVRGPSPGGLGADDVARALGVPLLAGMRPEPGLDRRLDGGELPGGERRSPLGRAATAVLRAAGVGR